ncbi:Alpha/Beta hydrolase protein [Geopyxis carbonaria]|nr:Alpha/Beta hydrolase protein [Geopyxis carbonaria]
MNFPTLLLLATSALVAASTTPPTVSTTSGTLHGTTLSNNTVTAYLGVPYAAPPTGSHRFLPPRPYHPPSASASFNATAIGPICHQFPGTTGSLTPGGSLTIIPDAPQSEDCLNLNVYSSTSYAATAPRAVMVFLHGGAFSSGTGAALSFDPFYILQDAPDILLVTLNYRLGLFGFPLTPALPRASTNPGLLDQRAALRWVQRNIAAFGGDAARITVFGESAGAVSADYMAYAYAADPIAAGFILESGTVELYPGDSLGDNDGAKFAAAAASVGCADPEDRHAELACLQRANATELRERAAAAASTGGEPHVDGWAVLGLAEFRRRSKEGLVARVPTVVGSNDAEGDNLGYVAAPVGNATADYAASDAFTLSNFTCPSARAAGDRAAAGAPVWRYRWMAAFPSSQYLPWLRAFHGSELLWVWGVYRKFGINAPWKPYERTAERWMHRAWVGFAKDPENGLEREVGWRRYGGAGTETLAEMFRDNEPVVGFVEGGKYDGKC